MTNEETILKIMKRHHFQIESLLKKFNKCELNSDEYLQTFNKFKWELKKHFLTEEKAIFTYIYDEDKDRLKKETDDLKSKYRDYQKWAFEFIQKNGLEDKYKKECLKELII